MILGFVAYNGTPCMMRLLCYTLMVLERFRFAQLKYSVIKTWHM